MKIVLATALYGSLLVASNGADNVQGSPSKLFDSNDARDSAIASVVMLQHDDLRTLFCDYKLLQSRIKRRVAVVDLGTKSSEVSLADHETVASLMAKTGLRDLWKNSWQPQLRLITKDAIYQSPASFNTPSKKAFLNREVKSGDTLVESMVE